MIASLSLAGALHDVVQNDRGSPCYEAWHCCDALHMALFLDRGRCALLGLHPAGHALRH